MVRIPELARDTCRAIIISVKPTSRKVKRKTGRKFEKRFYLVQQETGGFQGYSFAGGGVMEGETEYECLMRTVFMEGIDFPYDIKPICKPVTITTDFKAEFGIESGHSTHYYIFIEEGFVRVPIRHPRGDINSAKFFDLYELPLGADPSSDLTLNLKQQMALHYVFMDFETQYALHYHQFSDRDIEHLLHGSAPAFYYAFITGENVE